MNLRLRNLRLRYDVESTSPDVPPYQIVRQIWRGRTADIFLATAPDGRRRTKSVVIRRLRRELADDDDFRAMFFLQGRLAVRLRHSNVIGTLEVRRDGAEIVMVTEFLEGHSLAHMRQRSQSVTPIPLAVHLRVLTAVLDGLQYMHDSKEDEAPSGIVHGDVRPENVFVTHEGEVKLLHSGIESDEPTNVVDERLRYLAPERARCETADRRSDVFSVGIMLWEAITGLRFWQDWPASTILRRLSSEGLPVHSKWVPIAGRELFDIAERALLKDPDGRYASAREMREAIDGVLSRRSDATSMTVVRDYMRAAFASERVPMDEGVVDRSEPPSLQTSRSVEWEVEVDETEPPPSTGRSFLAMALTPPAGLPILSPESRKRTLLVLGAVGILSGGLLLGQALAPRNVVYRSAGRGAASACVDEVTARPPSPSPVVESPSRPIDDGETPSAEMTPTVASSPARTASPPIKPQRNRRIRSVDDRWGI